MSIFLEKNDIVNEKMNLEIFSFEIISFLFGLGVLLIIALDTIRFGISPMPTSKKARKALLSRIEKGVIYELGSGFGTLAVKLSRKTQVKAFEMALVPYLFSLLQKHLRRAENLTIRKKDFFSEDLSSADIVVCYLYPKAMQKLAVKFERELKKGTLVLSNSFQLPGRKPDETIEARDWMRSKIYCYKI